MIELKGMISIQLLKKKHFAEVTRKCVTDYIKRKRTEK